jgi:hypothetical protein
MHRILSTPPSYVTVLKIVAVPQFDGDGIGATVSRSGKQKPNHELEDSQNQTSRSVEMGNPHSPRPVLLI